VASASASVHVGVPPAPPPPEPPPPDPPPGAPADAVVVADEDDAADDATLPDPEVVGVDPVPDEVEAVQTVVASVRAAPAAAAAWSCLCWSATRAAWRRATSALEADEAVPEPVAAPEVAADVRSADEVGVDVFEVVAASVCAVSSLASVA
jgi:hypothetical protein